VCKNWIKILDNTIFITFDIFYSIWKTLRAVQNVIAKLTMLIIFLIIISYNIQTYQKTNLFSQKQKKSYQYIICVKKFILVPTEEIVINCSYFYAFWSIMASWEVW